MPLRISVSTSTGKTLFATLERLSDGFFWNQSTGAWANNPAAADRKVSLTEGTAANLGSYTASVSNLGDAGETRVRIHDDGDSSDKTIGVSQSYVWGGNEVLNVLAETVPGTYASGTAAAALGRIGSGQITTVSPVAQSGAVEVIRGDDYSAAAGSALEWTDASAAWPDLTSATIAFRAFSGFSTSTAAFEKAGSVVTATGVGKKVRVELTKTETAAFVNQAYPFEVVATLSSGAVWTLVRSSMTVKGE